MKELMRLKEIISNDKLDTYFIQTNNRKTLWVGCASFTRDNRIKVFEGRGNGEDDKVMSYDEFLMNYDFELVNE